MEGAEGAPPFAHAGEFKDPEEGTQRSTLVGLVNVHQRAGARVPESLCSTITS